MQIGFVRPESVVRVLYNAPIDWGTANSLSRLAPIPISPQTWKGGEQNPQTPPLNCGLLVATWVNGHLRHRHAHLRRIVFINIRGQKVTRGMSKGGLPAPPPHSLPGRSGRAPGFMKLLTTNTASYVCGGTDPKHNAPVPRPSPAHASTWPAHNLRETQALFRR